MDMKMREQKKREIGKGAKKWGQLKDAKVDGRK